MSRAVPRTAVAVLAALLLVAGVLVLTAARADSQPPLPEIGAAELLVSVRDAAEDPPPVAADVTASLALGLPEVEFEGAEELSAGSELAGDKRLRVWRSDDGFRVAELRDSSERALITDGETLWTWDSTDLEVVRTLLPDGMDHERTGPAQTADPLELARQALAAVDESTEVTVERTSRVAGRDAYRLVLEPRTDGTLVGRVELDIDAEERLPLRAAVYARGAAEPAVEAAYATVSFDEIDPATFAFVPPPGATVTERPLPAPPTDAEHEAFGQRYAEQLAQAEDAAAGPPEPVVVGEGWTTVVAVPTGGRLAEAGDTGAAGDAGGAAQQLTGLLPFSGPLFSVRTETVDGEEYLLVGAVPQEGLQAAAAEL